MGIHMGLYGMVPNDSRWANKQGKIAYGGGVYGAEIIISFSPQHTTRSLFREFSDGMRMTTWGFVSFLFLLLLLLLLLFAISLFSYGSYGSHENEYER